MERLGRLAVALTLYGAGLRARPVRHSNPCRLFLGLPSAGKRRFSVGCGRVSSRSYVPPSAKTPASKSKRPNGPTSGQWSRQFASGRPRSGGAAAASLDTEVLTQRGKTEDRHNSTAKRLRILTPRTEWLADMKLVTELPREQSAQKLEARSHAIGLERRREWRELKNVWRDRRTGRTSDRGERVARAELELGDGLRVVTDPRGGEAERGRLGARPFPDLGSVVVRDSRIANDVLERIGGAPELESHWHTSRAKTKRELFDRVAVCGTAEGNTITLVCRSCREAATIEVGCGSKWFCPTCRVQQVIKFRKDFERKRLGLVTAATRAGLTRRKQKRGERWGERLITFTLPHRGTVQERIEVLRATWLRFWRMLRERLLPTLQGPSGITFESLANGQIAKLDKDGNAKPRPYGGELALHEVLSYLHVFEWTPGKDDMLGHPHLHVWMFSRYIDNKEVLHPLWTRAYREVLRKRCPIGPIQELELLVPDARSADGDVGKELIKYLTKDWEISETGAKRAAPEVFAQVYTLLDGKRLKQSSSGFAMWAVEKANVCPCCNYEPRRGHWARIDIEHTLDKVTERLGRHVPTGHFVDADGRYTPTPLAGAGEYELRAAHDATIDAAWITSHERTIVRARMRGLGIEPPDTETHEQPTEPTEDDDPWQTNLW